MIGTYAYFGLGADASSSIKTVLVFLLIFGVSGLMGVFGMVPGVKSSAQRMRERERRESESEEVND
jgi:hypothetical protein